MNLKEKKTTETKTKHIRRTGTDPEKWISHEGISVGTRRGELEGKVQGRRSILSSHKIDREP